MTPRLKLLIAPLLLCSALQLTGCTTNPATGDQSFTAFMTEQDEQKVGAEEHPKIIEAFGGEYGGPKLKRYVENVGKALAAVSEVPNLPYKFTILNDEKVNAFALPGGYVYITRGLLALAENEAEMAGVLAHEIGHITARHSAQRYSTSMATNIGLTVLGVIGSMAGIPSGLNQVVSQGAQAAVQGYSRQQELEADMLGVRYMTRLGYSPDAMTTFFRKMGAHAQLEAQSAGQAGVSHNIMSTHPRTEDRIRQAFQLAKTKPVKNPLLEREAYLAQIDGMVFGDDPSQGIRKGRTFTHPELRIQFEVPPDFVMFNSQKQVVAIGPSQSRIIFDMASPEAVRQSNNDLRRYVQFHWGSNIALQNVEAIDINGMPAATGGGRLETSAGLRDVRLLALRGDADKIFRLAFITPPEMTGPLNEGFRRTTYSFHRLSPTQASAIRPLKINVIPIQPGDTVVSLADQMPFEKYKREWFRLLNALDVGDKLTVGQKIKIVAE